MGYTKLAETKVADGRYAAKPHRRGFKGGKFSPFARYNFGDSKIGILPSNPSGADCHNYFECDCECYAMAASY